MSIWASEAGRNAQGANGDKIKGMIDVYGSATTDSNGQFQVDLTQFNLVEILDATAVITGQTLDAADNIVDKLTATVIEVTDTVIKGVVTQPQAIDVTTGVGEIAPIQRGGAGNNVKVKVTGRK